MPENQNRDVEADLLLCMVQSPAEPNGDFTPGRSGDSDGIPASLRTGEGVIGNETFVPVLVRSEKIFDINGIFLIDKRTLVV